MVNAPELHLRVGEVGVIGLVCLLQVLFGLNREHTAILPRVAWSAGAVLSCPQYGVFCVWNMLGPQSSAGQGRVSRRRGCAKGAPRRSGQPGMPHVQRPGSWGLAQARKAAQSPNLRGLPPRDQACPGMSWGLAGVDGVLW